MTPAKLIVPTIHLNGTSRYGLLDPIREALRALREAEDKVGRTAPHPRDYYPQGDAIYARAAALHRERLVKLHEVITELQSIGTAIIASG